MNLITGSPISAKDPEDCLAVRMLAHILAGGQNSRLFRQIRNKRGKTYGLEHAFSFYRSSGLFSIYGAIDHNGYEDTIADIMKTIDRFLDVGPTDAEVADTNKASLGYFHNAQLEPVGASREILNLLDYGWTTAQINNIDQIILNIDLKADRHRQNLIPSELLTIISA